MAQKNEYTNKKRILAFSSRNLNSRERHFLNDIRKLLPHSKNESKLSAKAKLPGINEICELRGCGSALFIEKHRKYDFLWISLSPSGPSARFLLQNVMTMGELKLTGNCLRGSRPLLRFDPGFESSPHFKTIKELLIKTFSTPNAHPKSKPFIDHIFSFSLLDDRIWFRNYQIVADENDKTKPAELVEIGPRFVLNPQRIFSGSFYGATLWQNDIDLKSLDPLEYKRARGYQTNVRNKRKTKKSKSEAVLPKTELDEVFDA